MAQSHTATDQWQSFELRMRRRRIERCVRRATDALGSGTLDVATDAIEEAAHLDPGDDEIKSLAAKIRAAAVPSPIVIDSAPPRHTGTILRLDIDAPALSVAPRVIPSAVEPIETASLDGTLALEEEASSGGSRHWFAIAAALIVLSGMTGWIWTRAQLTSTPREPDAVVAIAQTTLPAPVTESPAPAGDTAPPEPTATIPPAASESSPDLTAATSGSAAEAPAAEPSTISKPLDTSAAPQAAVKQAAAESTALPAVTLPPARTSDRAAETPTAAVSNGAPPPTPDPAPAPASVAAEPAPSVAPLLIPTADSASLSAAIGESVAARAPQVPDGNDSAAEERAIRAVLGRYEAAYNRLDAAAASAVRPSIDRQALARAFEGLVSQTVKLGSCAVTVTGVSAQAACAGTAQWTPRIGGQTQIAKRQWRFDMKKTGADRIIVSANVR